MDGTVVIGVELNSSSFEAALSQLRKDVSQTATSLVQELSDAGTDGGSALLTGLLETDTETAGRTLAAWAATGFAPTSFSATGHQAGVSLSSGFSSVGSSLANASATLASRVKGAFSLGWYALGYNISSGIANGIQGGSSLITAAANSAARSALASAKRTLGVNSPSRVFRDEVGRMIPAGMAQGIFLETPQVTEALRQQSSQIVDTARRDVVPNLSLLKSGSQTPVVSGKSDIRLTVEAPLVIDGREMARATVRYTGEQLLWEAM